MATTGTLSPIIPARRVPSQSLTSTRACWELFRNLTTDDIMATVGTTHQMALCTAAHPANMAHRFQLHRTSWREVIITLQQRAYELPAELRILHSKVCSQRSGRG